MARDSWTPVSLVKVTAEYLAGKDVPTPKLDAELLLVHALKLENRVQLYTQHDRPLSDEELSTYRDLTRRRANREPVSRILGETEFMGRRIAVTPGVFAPRADTEILVEEAVKLLAPPKKTEQRAKENEDSGILFRKVSTNEMEAVDVEDRTKPKTRAWTLEHDAADVPVNAEEVQDPDLRDPKRILEIGTGSGCIAISLVLFCRDAYVVTTDIDSAALTVARENAEPHALWERIDFREGFLYEACWENEEFDMIVSNPPYLVEGDPEIWPEARDYDPPAALYGGHDGLDCYRGIAAGACTWLKPGGHILVEVGAGQHQQVLDLFAEAGLTKLRTLKDHAGIERVVIGRNEE